MSLQLSHNSGCGVQITGLFFSLKTENWYRLISFSVISLAIVLLCTVLEPQGLTCGPKSLQKIVVGFFSSAVGLDD